MKHGAEEAAHHGQCENVPGLERAVVFAEDDRSACKCEAFPTSLGLPISVRRTDNAEIKPLCPATIPGSC